MNYKQLIKYKYKYILIQLHYHNSDKYNRDLDIELWKFIYDDTNIICIEPYYESFDYNFNDALITTNESFLRDLDSKEIDTIQYKSSNMKIIINTNSSDFSGYLIYDNLYKYSYINYN